MSPTISASRSAISTRISTPSCVRYGFMDEPNIPRALAQCRVMQFRFNLMETSFFVGREKIVAGTARLASGAGASGCSSSCRTRCSTPPSSSASRTNRVVELGGQIEI